MRTRNATDLTSHLIEVHTGNTLNSSVGKQIRVRLYRMVATENIARTVFPEIKLNRAWG